MTNATELSRWIPAKCLHLQAPGNCRLFCFPYAGAGGSVFRNWQDFLPPTIEVVPVQLPGRESRWSEQPLQDLPLLAATLATAIRPLLFQPFVLFGHSMGALIAFELARVLRRRRLPLPRHLFASGARAPHVPDREPPVHHLPDVLLWKTVMRDYGAAQDRTPLNPEMAPVLLPILRTDFRMCESYKPSWEDPFPFPLTVYGGFDDRRVTYHDLSAWSGYTLGAFRMQLFRGGHFFLARNSDLFLKAFSGDLAGLASSKKTVTCIAN
jgi:surfactin synthase thioesterase subunit